MINQPRLAIVTTHPIQYYAPWFRYIHLQNEVVLKVFYLWDSGVKETNDVGFDARYIWDVPLLDGYEHEFVPNISSRPGTHHFWGIRNPQLKECLRRFKPHAVLLLGYNFYTFMSLILTWRECPLLFRGDSHRLVPRDGICEYGKRCLISMVFKRFSAFPYVGQANREYLCLHGVRESQLFFSPHAIDNARFSANENSTHAAAREWKQELGIPTDCKVVLFAGKFISQKRPLDLLEAFIRASIPNAALLFVGSGELESAIRKRVTLRDPVYLAPFQNQQQMPRTYAAADLIVLPSYGPKESWGLCINEAMCLQKPVIVSTHVGCAADLVQSEKNGLIFEAGNPVALEDALRLALKSRTKLYEWGERSFEIIQQYSFKQATEGLFRALIFSISPHV